MAQSREGASVDMWMGLAYAGSIPAVLCVAECNVQRIGQCNAVPAYQGPPSYQARIAGDGQGNRPHTIGFSK